MRHEIIFEDGEIAGMLANPEVAAAFPAIVALKPAPMPGNCVPCKQAAEQRRIATAYNQIRRLMAKLPQDDWDRLLDILEARRAVLIYFGETNSRVRLVFSRTNMPVT